MIGATTYGEVVEVSDLDEWLAAVGPFSTICFDEVPLNTFVTDQYVGLGLHFTDGDDLTLPIPLFSDGVGLHSSFLPPDFGSYIHIAFERPQSYVAIGSGPSVVSGSSLRVELFSLGQLIHVVDPLLDWEFFGMLSSDTFDAVALIRDFPFAIDDLCFGAAGALGDLDGDFSVGILDLLSLLASWGACPPPPDQCPADIDGDGMVGVLDLLELLANWG